MEKYDLELADNYIRQLVEFGFGLEAVARSIRISGTTLRTFMDGVETPAHRRMSKPINEKILSWYLRRPK